MLAACVALVKRSVAGNHILTSATHAATIPGRTLFGRRQALVAEATGTNETV